MTTTIIVDLKSCRVCLLRNGSISVFEKRNEMIIADMITECTNVQIKQDDDYPKNICDSCVVKVVTAYSFKIECHNSNSIIQMVFSKEIICEKNEFEAEYLDDVQEHSEILTVNKNEKKDNIDWEFKCDQKYRTNALQECHMKTHRSINVKDSINNIEQTKNTNENSNIKLKCDNFDENFEYKHELKKHSELRNKSFECNICNQTFKREDLFKFHQMLHSNEFKCEVCQMKFTNLRILRLHIKKKHSESPNRKILTINESVKNKKPSLSELNIEFVNPVCLSPISYEDVKIVDVFTCNVCLKEFDQEALLIEHKNDHLTETNLKCKISDKSYDPNHQLKGHINTQEALENTITFVDCSVVTNENSILVEDDPIKSVIFKEINETILNEHKIDNYKLLAPKPIERDALKIFACSVCCKVFDQKEKLNIHIKENHIDWEFQCKLCDKKYRKNALLECHMQTHASNNVKDSFKNIERTKNINKKPNIKFRCNNCDEMFELKSELKKHSELHNKSFKCNVCNETFKREDLLKYHQMIHLNEFICELCQMKFLNLRNLRLHMKKRHSGLHYSKPFGCNICNRYYKSEELLKYHKIMLHNSNELFPCPDCQKKFSTFGSLNYHMKNKHSELPNIKPSTKLFECNICNETFERVELFKYHEMLHLNEFQCEVCQMKFSNVRNLNNHINQKHTKKQFICEICSKEYYYRRELIRHQSIIHRKEKPFKCDICDKKFSSKCILNRHLRCHTGEKPYKCRFCDTFFRDFSSMSAHTKILHTGDAKYKCDICPKKCVTPNTLLIHKRIHTGEKPYQCQHCNKEFARFSSLKLHKLIHTDERPHECEICNKKFRLRHTLNRHLILHTGEKPYECTFCNAKYANKSNARTHTKYYCKDNPNKIKVNKY